MCFEFPHRLLSQYYSFTLLIIIFIFNTLIYIIHLFYIMTSIVHIRLIGVSFYMILVCSVWLYQHSCFITCFIHCAGNSSLCVSLCGLYDGMPECFNALVISASFFIPWGVLGLLEVLGTPPYTRSRWPEWVHLVNTSVILSHIYIQGLLYR